VLALGAGEVPVGVVAASFLTVPVGAAEDLETDGLEAVVDKYEELVVGRGVGFGLMLAAAAATIPDPSVGSGTFPLTCQPRVAIGHAGGLLLGL